ncbi:hypothetical protein P8452_64983 [Trifolium repens]|nr:hypothetical protein P8452_64983 [Trifolium repens]
MHKLNVKLMMIAQKLKYMIFVNNHVTCNLQFLNALTTYVQWLLWMAHEKYEIEENNILTNLPVDVLKLIAKRLSLNDS